MGGEGFEEGLGEGAHVGGDAQGQRLVEAEDGLVGVDLDHLLLGAAPVGRLAPPVGLPEARAEDHHHVGGPPGLVHRLHGRDREAVGVPVGQGASGGPAGGHRGPEGLGEPGEGVVGLGVDHAAACVEVGALGAGEKLRRCLDVGSGRGQRREAPVGRRRARLLGGLEGAVEDVLGDVEVDHPGAPLEAGPEGLAGELAEAVAAGDQGAELRHRPGHAGLVEVLVGAPALRADDLVAPMAGDQQHPIPLGALDGDPGEDVGDPRAVGGDAHPEAPGDPGVGPGHVGGARLVAGRDETDPVLLEAGEQPQVGSVDDAEDGVDPFGGEHRGEELAAYDLSHLAPPGVGTGGDGPPAMRRCYHVPDQSVKQGPIPMGMIHSGAPPQGSAGIDRA